jgi:hypothetical protein
MEESGLVSVTEISSGNIHVLRADLILVAEVVSEYEYQQQVEKAQARGRKAREYLERVSSLP